LSVIKPLRDFLDFLGSFSIFVNFLGEWSPKKIQITKKELIFSAAEENKNSPQCFKSISI